MTREAASRFVWRHPFLVVGLVTLAMFWTIEALSRAGYTQPVGTLAPALRVIIVPMYLGWMLLSIIRWALYGNATAVGQPDLVVRILWVLAGLLPYMLADLLLGIVRRQRVKHEARF